MSRISALLVHLLLCAFVLTGCRAIQRPAAASEQPLKAADTGVAEAAALPMDPEVRVGKLPNGFTYYVRPNSATPERAELWLVVNAGSVLEEEDQQGLAHFLEHIQFQGTEHFPGPEVLRFLQSLGTEFGPEINAYTSFDVTVYTLQTPTDDPKQVQQALDLLADWSGSASLDADAIEAERDIIVEEWRTRELDADGRVSEALYKTLLAGSRYVERLPIGDMEIVRAASAATLRRFYQAWYRPDNMAVIAVGDFADVDEVEAWIRTRFGELPAPVAPLERPDLTVPDYGNTSVQIITDPEIPTTSVSVAYRQPDRTLLTTDDYRTLLVDYLAVMMLNQRYKEIARQPEAAFLFASAGMSDLVRGVELDTINVRMEEDRIVAGFAAAMAEIERVRQHGFLAAELDNVKTLLLREFESRSVEKENLTNSVYAGGYLQHFLTGSIATGFGDDYIITEELLPTITPADVAARFDALYHDGNRAVILVAPAKEETSLPDEAELAAVLDEAAAETLSPYAGAEVSGELVSVVPAPAAIIEEEEFPELGLTRIKLQNGVQIYLKPTDFKDDEVLLVLSSLGGISLVDDADVPAAGIGASLIQQSGAGPYSMTELEKLLADKRVSVTPFLGELDEGFTSVGSAQDLETIFQLVYLYATQPRLDPDVATRFGRAAEEYLKNRSLQPSTALDDKYLELMCGEDPRCNHVTLTERFVDVDPQRVLEVFQERFSDLDDAIVLLVGSFEIVEAKQLAQRYLGALPSTAADGEMWLDKRHPLPEGQIRETVYGGIEPRSEVRIYFTGPFTMTLENQVALAMLTEVLKGVVADDLRQTRAGIYEANITGNAVSLPSGRYEVAINFTAEPERVEELTAAVFEQIALLREYGPSASNYARVLRQLRRDHEENLQSNAAWLQWLILYVLNQPGQLSEILRVDEVIEAITPEDIRALANELLPEDRNVVLIQHPQQ